MRILYLYQDIPAYGYDRWLREHFILQISKYRPNYKVLMYGPGVHKVYPKFCAMPYEEKCTFKKLQKLYRFDVVLIAQKSRMHIVYYPDREENETWLFQDFSELNVPKIVIEEDYHYERDDEWYVQNGINLILQRHYSQSLREQTIPMRWFPFSVDPEVFQPGSSERINKLCLTGSSEGDVYRHRREVYERLSKVHMAEGFLKRQKIGIDYVKNLQEYVGHINCGSIYEINPAKCFEIMASGSVLFTNKFQGIDQLFPDNAYCSYKNDLSDVIDQAKRIINDTDYAQSISNAALDCIYERHTHKQRIDELIRFINSFVKDINPIRPRIIKKESVQVAPIIRS